MMAVRLVLEGYRSSPLLTAYITADELLVIGLLFLIRRKMKIKAIGLIVQVNERF
jgi:hypothetical protein